MGYLGEYLITGLFVSGSIASIVFIKTSLSSKLCNEYIHYRIVLNFSVMLYSKILENLRCRESVSYTYNVTINVRSSKFQTSFQFYS